MSVRVAEFDARVSARIALQPRTPRGRRAYRGLHRVSQTASYGGAWIIAFALVVILAGGIVRAVIAAAGVIAILLINSGIKFLVRRPRPARSSLLAARDFPRSYSFPSAHAAMAVVGAIALTSLATPLWPVWWLYTAVVALSRVLLGVHYLGDVLVGMALGTLWALTVVLPIMHAV